ncbi:hypothetical protein HK098_003045 [Nowakowskiella sp. JEL0407]|nr:hypothetical protein HK098_003045 [Nowakowskiella sp. JEL0407]
MGSIQYIQQSLFWMFVPSMATNFIQSRYYDIFYNTNNRPQRNDKKFKQDYRLIFILLSPEMQLAYEETYINIRNAYEMLKDPLTQAGYEKFGPNASQNCRKCLTDRDFLYSNIVNVASFYVGILGFNLLLLIFSKNDFGRYWRLVGLLILGAAEFSMLVNSSNIQNQLRYSTIFVGGDVTADSIKRFLGQVLGKLQTVGFLPTFLELIFPWRTTHEKLAMLHQIYVVLCIALAQVGPMIMPPSATPGSAEERQLTKNRIQELEMLTNMQMHESSAMYREVFEPFAGGEGEKSVVEDLQRKMEKMAVDLQLMSFEPKLDRRRKVKSPQKKK